MKLIEKIKNFSMKERIKDSKEKYKVAVQLGNEKGLNLIITRYDKYRKFMYWVLLGIIIFLIGYGKLLEAIILFFLWHVHTVLNQIWYKLRNIEEWIKENENNTQEKEVP